MPCLHTPPMQKRTAQPDARLSALLAAATAAPPTAPSPAWARAALAQLTAGLCPAPEAMPAWGDVALHTTAARDILGLSDDFGRDFSGDYPDNLQLRYYDPAPDDSDLPLCLYLHGGGHMAGSVDVYHLICARLSKIAHMRVLALDYRLSPENPWPRGLLDAAACVENMPLIMEKLRWKMPAQWAVAGDSAGGALTATLAMKMPEKITRQILIYPSLDYLLQSESVKENANGYLLEMSRVRWYFDQYFQGTVSQQERKMASPLHMCAGSGRPDALIFTAGFCPLRDEAWDYAARWEKIGGKSCLIHYPAMVHAFLNLHALVPDICEDVYTKIGQFVRGQAV